MIVMETVSQAENLAMALVLRDMLSALTVSAEVRNIILNAMKHAITRKIPAMEGVQMDGLIVEVGAAMKRGFMIVMELAPPSLSPAMEVV